MTEQKLLTVDFRTECLNVRYSKFIAYMKENSVEVGEIAGLLGKTVSRVNQNLNGTAGDFSMADVRKMCLTYGISSDKYFC